MVIRVDQLKYLAGDEDDLEPAPPPPEVIQHTTTYDAYDITITIKININCITSKPLDLGELLPDTGATEGEAPGLGARADPHQVHHLRRHPLQESSGSQHEINNTDLLRDDRVPRQTRNVPKIA